MTEKDNDTRERLIRLEEAVNHLTADVTTVKADVTDIKAQANRWKGGFAVVLVLGGALGWLASTLIDIKRLIFG